MEEKQYKYIEFARILSTTVVILDHIMISAIKIFNENSTTNDDIFAYSIRNLSHFAVPIFIMITGCLLLNPQKYIDYRKIKNNSK